MPLEKRVLVVDDEPDVLDAVQYRLEQAGYLVVVATNGFEALGAARATSPDVVVLDVMLPRENGYRVARMLREDEDLRGGPRTGIILLTARDLRTDPEREQMFMEFSRADQVIYKPFDLDELVRAVEGRIVAHGGAEAVSEPPVQTEQVSA